MHARCNLFRISWHRLRGRRARHQGEGEGRGGRGAPPARGPVASAVAAAEQTTCVRRPPCWLGRRAGGGSQLLVGPRTRQKRNTRGSRSDGDASLFAHTGLAIVHSFSCAVASPKKSVVIRCIWCKYIHFNINRFGAQDKLYHRVTNHSRARPEPDHTTRLPRAAALIGHAVGGRAAEAAAPRPSPRHPRARLRACSAVAWPPPRIALLKTSLSRHTHRHLLAPTGTFRHHPAPPAGASGARLFSPPRPFWQPTTPPHPLLHTTVSHRRCRLGTQRRPPPAASSTVSARRAASARARRCRLAQPGHAGLVGPGGPAGVRGERLPTAVRGGGALFPPVPTPPPTVTPRRASAGVRAAGGARRLDARAGPAPSCHGPYPARRGCCPGTGPVYFFFFFGGRSSGLDVGGGGEGEGGRGGRQGREARALRARRCCTAHHPPPPSLALFLRCAGVTPAIHRTPPLPSPPLRGAYPRHGAWSVSGAVAAAPGRWHTAAVTSAVGVRRRGGGRDGVGPARPTRGSWAALLASGGRPSTPDVASSRSPLRDI